MWLTSDNTIGFNRLTVPSAAVLVERFAPLAIGVGISVLFFFKSGEVYGTALRNSWDVSAFYAAVFDFSSILCAFLFSFWVFTKTTSNKVMDSFRGTSAYESMMKYFRRSIISSFLLTLTTIPLLVAVPTYASVDTPSYVLLGLWFGLLGYALAAVVRSAYQFISVIDASYSSRFKG